MSSIDQIIANQVSPPAASGGGGTVDVSTLAKAAQLPASLGANTSANSLPVVLSSDGPFSTNFGSVTDAAATNSTGSWSAIALLKALFGRFLPFSTTASSGAGSVVAIQTDYTPVPANTSRKFLSVTNTHASATLVVNPVGAAYTGGAYVGISLVPGGTYEWSGVTVPNGALHVASATAGTTFFIVEG